MQNVSTRFKALLQSRVTDLVSLIELYHYNAVPGASGFDPAQTDFVKGYAATTGITFRTRNFEQKINSFGDVKRTITKEFNSFNFTLNNQDRTVAALNFSLGFEGLIAVVRLVSRSVSANLDDSIVLFVGRCDKPDSFDRSSEAVQISAKQIIGSIELQMPRRKFSPDDEDGRHPSDPLFEGFRFSVQYGSVNYSVRERRGGLLGLLGFKKTVTKTLQYSSHSALDSELAVPEVFGRAQMSAHHIGYIDLGTAIQTNSAFCEGQIKDLVNVRSVTPGFDIFPGVLNLAYGELGGVGNQQMDPAFVAPGFYSRTAHIRAGISGTTAQQDDPAPDIVAMILGRLVDLPDTSGVYNRFDWSDNPVHIARYILTSPDFLKLTQNFVDDAINWQSANYCDEVLLDQSGTDAVYLPPSLSGIAGVSYDLYKPTSTVSPEYLSNVHVDPHSLSLARITDPAKRKVNYNFYSGTSIPIEPPDDPGGGHGGGGGGQLQLPSFVLRRRYTANVVVTEQQKTVDFLFNVLFPAARLFLITTAQGKVGIRVAKPVDNSTLRIDAAAGATTIAVWDILQFNQSYAGKLLLGAYLTTSELVAPTGYRFTTASNSITLSATGATASGATLAGANNAASTATGTFTFADTTGAKTIVIDGYSLTYTPIASDTTATVAGFFNYAVNGHPVLQKYVRADWTGGNVVTITSKMGFIDLAAALVRAHSAGITSPTDAPIIAANSGGNLPPGNFKVSYGFLTHSGETLPSPQITTLVTAGQKLDITAVPLPTGAIGINWYCSVAGDTTMLLRLVHQNSGEAFSITDTPSRIQQIEKNYNSTGEELIRVTADFNEQNTISGSFKYPIGSRQPAINRIDLKFNDSVQDFRATELRVKDVEHIARVKKVLAKEVSGAAIDNFHQAVRIANGNLAEAREGDFFTAHTGDGDALLLDEGDVITVSDDSGGLVRLPVRIEEITVKNLISNPVINVTAKKYSKSFYSDDAPERVLPIPTYLNLTRTGSPENVQTFTADALVSQPTNVVNSSSARTITLPTASGITGRRFLIKNIGTGAAIVTPATGETIDGATSKTLVQYDVLEIMSNGANWLVL